MTKSTKDYIQYVKAIVATYLKDKPHLLQFREDMEQEGMVAIFKAEKDYSEYKGNMDKDLYLHYMTKQRVIDYVRKETRHFRKPMDEDGSSYWGHEIVPGVDELMDMGDKGYSPGLKDYLEKINLKPNEEVILESYLRLGEYRDVAKELGKSRQFITRVINRIVERCALLEA